MTKTLVALVLIAGGILLVTRSVDTDKSVPARLSPPTGADQISEARRVSPTMSARDVCNLIDQTPLGLGMQAGLGARALGGHSPRLDRRAGQRAPFLALQRHCCSARLVS